MNMLGNHNNVLNANSLALTSDIGSNFPLGDPIFVNGVYLGNYDDTVPPYTIRGVRYNGPVIDAYDPTNAAGGEGWGIILRRGGYTITNHPEGGR